MLKAFARPRSQVVESALGAGRLVRTLNDGEDGLFVRVVPLALLLTSCILLSACDTGERVIRIGAAVSESGRYAEEGNHTPVSYTHLTLPTKRIV